MIERKQKLHEVEIKFLVPVGSYGAKTKKELLENLQGIGGNEMGCIECQEVKIFIDGKKMIEG